MVVVQKKKTMPDNKKMNKDLTTLDKKTGRVLGTAVVSGKLRGAKRKIKKNNEDIAGEVSKGIEEGLAEAMQAYGPKTMVDKIKELNKTKQAKEKAPFKMKLGNKPSIAKFMRINGKTK